jgi:hypothetical protein
MSPATYRAWLGYTASSGGVVRYGGCPKGDPPHADAMDKTGAGGTSHAVAFGGTACRRSALLGLGRFAATRLQELDKLINGHVCLANDRPERASV